MFNAAVGRPEKPSGAASAAPVAASGLGTEALATEAKAEAEADAEVDGARFLPVIEAPPANALSHELVVQVNLLEPAPHVPAPARAFPFALDPFQKHAVALLEQHQNVCSGFEGAYFHIQLLHYNTFPYLFLRSQRFSL